MNEEQIKSRITYLKSCEIFADGVSFKQKMPKDVVFAVIKIDGISTKGKTLEQMDNEVIELIKNL